MRQRIVTSLSVGVLMCAAIFIGKTDAATLGTQVTVSPMPFTPGQTVSIKANVSGPFSNATEYVSVSDGTQILFEKTMTGLGAIAQGQTKSFSVNWVVPSNLGAKTLSVFIVFLEGPEKYVGEPGPDRSLKLVPRCPARPSKTPCRYATARYWIQTTRPA